MSGLSIRPHGYDNLDRWIWSRIRRVSKLVVLIIVYFIVGIEFPIHLVWASRAVIYLLGGHLLFPELTYGDVVWSPWDVILLVKATTVG